MNDDDDTTAPPEIANITAAETIPSPVGVFRSEQSPPAVTMTAARAERLTKVAAEHLDVMANAYEQVLPIMRELYEGQAFKALGYKSHGAYILDRFSGSLARLGINARRLAVLELTNQGMSVRAVAGVLGVSVGTVQSDRVEVFSSEQLPELITGLDGKTRPSTQPGRKLTPSVKLWGRLIAEDEERAWAWVRQEHNDLFGGSLWEKYTEDKAGFVSLFPDDVPRVMVNAAAIRSYTRRQVAMAMWIKAGWAEDEDAQREHQTQDPTWPYDRYDSWQSCIRGVLQIDPYAAVYGGIVADIGEEDW